MGWYEALKDVASIADRLRDAELKQRLADVQVECAKLAEENARLRNEIVQLRGQAQLNQEMRFQNNVYWRHIEGGNVEGPYCPRCLDGNRKSARMTDTNSYSWSCPVCGWSTLKPGATPPNIQMDTALF